MLDLRPPSVKSPSGKELPVLAARRSGAVPCLVSPVPLHMTAGGYSMSPSRSTSEDGFAPHIGRSVSIDHAAQLLDVSRRTIYNRIRDGRLQTMRTIGGSQRVLTESI